MQFSLTAIKNLCWIAVVLFVSGDLLAQEAEQKKKESPVESPIELQAAHDELNEDLIYEIEKLLEWCQENNLSHAESHLQKFTIKRDPDRQYLFILSEFNQPTSRFPAIWPDELKSKTKKLFQAHIDSLLELAKRNVDAEQGSKAVRLLNEILFFDPQYGSVRKMLGYQTNNRAKTRMVVKPSRKQHPIFKWEKGSWHLASTPRFKIDSRANKEQTEQLTVKMERWLEVWRQLFFDYYRPVSQVEKWMAGRSSQRPASRRFDVVFFASREEYIAELSPRIPGIEASTGYYDGQHKTSFFYASDDPLIEDTWRHEFAHQMFQESRQSVKSPFDEQFLWLGEGIAMYFESYIDHGGYVTVGGFDSRRLQYARLRRLKEQFRFPLEELSKLGRQEFQRLPDIPKIYSQSAGIAHYLMDSNNGTLQKSLMEFLELAYRGRLRPGTFSKVIGQSSQEIEEAYAEYLKVDPKQIANLIAAEKRRELALIGVRLDEDSLDKLWQCSKLDWLELSGSDARGQRLKPLKSCESIDQLFLTGSKLDDAAVEILKDLKVRDLDLSGTDLSDKQLGKLIESKTLRVLNVAGSRVSSHGVRTVASQRPDIQLESNFNSGRN